MATAHKVLRASLLRILVQADEAELEPSDYQDAIDSMNNYMLSLDAMGVQLGYTVVENLEDEVTVPPGALRGLIANVAVEVAPDYGGQVSDTLVVAATAGFQAMLQLGISLGRSRYPSTLPVGSGNEGEGYSTYGNQHFYPGLEDEILAETTGSIALEVSTNQVAEGAG